MESGLPNNAIQPTRFAMLARERARRANITLLSNRGLMRPRSRVADGKRYAAEHSSPSQVQF